MFGGPLGGLDRCEAATATSTIASGHRSGSNCVITLDQNLKGQMRISTEAPARAMRPMSCFDQTARGSIRYI
jgi:hypothetical protein